MPLSGRCSKRDSANLPRSICAPLASREIFEIFCIQIHQPKLWLIINSDNRVVTISIRKGLEPTDHRLWRLVSVPLSIDIGLRRARAQQPSSHPPFSCCSFAGSSALFFETKRADTFHQPGQHVLTSAASSRLGPSASASASASSASRPSVVAPSSACDSGAASPRIPTSNRPPIRQV